MQGHGCSFGVQYHVIEGTYRKRLFRWCKVKSYNAAETARRLRLDRDGQQGSPAGPQGR